MTDGPYVGAVADLLDPYLSREAKTSLGGKPATGGDYAIWWLRTHPGRWALVGEGTRGMSREMLERVGLKCANRTSKIDGITRIYGQCPHPEAEELREAIRRTPVIGHDLPMLVKSEFGWTPEELAEACQVARHNLFPVGRGRR